MWSKSFAITKFRSGVRIAAAGRSSRAGNAEWAEAGAAVDQPQAMAGGMVASGLPWRMADTSEAAAELRISRVKALDERNLVSIVTYMLARYPDTFPAMLDDALSTLTPKADD